MKRIVSVLGSIPLKNLNPIEIEYDREQYSEDSEFKSNTGSMLKKSKSVS